MKFVSRLEAGEKMSDLCREFGISRKTGYKFLERYKAKGAAGLFDESRRPRTAPHRTPQPTRELLASLKRKHPTWGPKKIRDLALRRHQGVEIPAATTVGTILRSYGLSNSRKKRRKVPLYEGPMTRAAAPNELWCMDYKGQFRLGNGRPCYPLTISDAFSRYLLACEGFEAIHGPSARDVLDALFEQYGVPVAMLSDNGPPFAGRGLFGLSQLNVYLLRQGVRCERIEPGHPEQNGRHERMHRTLKAETTRPAAHNLLAQQERFDVFRETYNCVRPHEALDMRTPSEVYQNGQSRKLVSRDELSYPLHDDMVRVDVRGTLLLPGQHRCFLTTALAGEWVGLRELDDDRWLVSFASLDLGEYSFKTRKFLSMDAH